MRSINNPALLQKEGRGGRGRGEFRPAPFGNFYSFLIIKCECPIRGHPRLHDPHFARGYATEKSQNHRICQRTDRLRRHRQHFLPNWNQFQRLNDGRVVTPGTIKEKKIGEASLIYCRQFLLIFIPVPAGTSKSSAWGRDWSCASMNDGASYRFGANDPEGWCPAIWASAPKWRHPLESPRTERISQSKFNYSFRNPFIHSLPHPPPHPPEFLQFLICIFVRVLHSQLPRFFFQIVNPSFRHCFASSGRSPAPIDASKTCENDFAIAILAEN